MKAVEGLDRERYFRGELGARHYLHERGCRTVAIAAGGDTYATSLVRRSVVQISMVVGAAMKLVPPDESLPICFRGGLLERYPHYCRALAHHLRGQFPNLSLGGGCHAGGYSTIVGATLLALRIDDLHRAARDADLIARSLPACHLIPTRTCCCDGN
ncbi:MAG TPA: hypothetical protein VH702_12765 [Vicinamibacterales bacterium]